MSKGRRLSRFALVRKGISGNSEVVVVIYMEKPAVTNAVGDPDGSPVFRPVVN